MRIGVVAPSSTLSREAADAVAALAAAHFPAVELLFHPHCFLTHNHFAGTDDERAEALIDVANDPGIEAVWFARGGYGACRIAERVIDALGSVAAKKTYLGYSDAGFLLAGLYRHGIGTVAHGPMPADILRRGGEAAVLRALTWLTGQSGEGVEDSVTGDRPRLAFNIAVLGSLLGTALEPDFDGHVLMLEEVSEHTYRTDRALFHITSQVSVRRVAGIRIGRCSLVPVNDRDFGATEAELAQLWCDRAGIPYLGIADIGHDSDNKVVPFGRPVASR